MTDNITQLPRRQKVNWLVYVAGERQPTWIEASDFQIDETHLLTFLNGTQVIAVFHQWDYFECAGRESAEGAA